jgi:SAM-dependent methyltransferase
MSTSVTQRACPVCGSPYANASIFLEENLDHSKINAYSYASRKNPEFMCHELSRCNKCDLIFTGNPPSGGELSENYHMASFDSSEEANDASDTYGISLASLLQRLPHKNNALEIGAGTGIFLEELKKRGFKNVTGVEPSLSAIEAAPKYRQEWVLHGVFDSQVFEKNSFDLVCCFMTLEHIFDPLEIAKESYNLLNFGGAVAFVVHDSNAWINKILGRKSPIIDIEHLQIFSKKSITQLLKNSNFDEITVHSFKNRYKLSYWVKLLPLPSIVKSTMLKILVATRLSEIKISINVGNLVAYGIKSKL